MQAGSALTVPPASGVRGSIRLISLFRWLRHNCRHRTARDVFSNHMPRLHQQLAQPRSIVPGEPQSTTDCCHTCIHVMPHPKAIPSPLSLELQRKHMSSPPATHHRQAPHFSCHDALEHFFCLCEEEPTTALSNQPARHHPAPPFSLHPLLHAIRLFQAFFNLASTRHATAAIHYFCGR